jgi:hypothetical protein
MHSRLCTLDCAADCLYSEKANSLALGPAGRWEGAVYGWELEVWACRRETATPPDPG